jgi:hypothetical protein
MRIVRNRYGYWKSQLYPKLEETLDEEWLKRHPGPFGSLPRFPGW